MPDHCCRLCGQIRYIYAMKRIILITGGQRSGKSGYAEALALSLSPSPVYIATAHIWDEDFRARVVKHQQRRGPEWTNMEEEINLPNCRIEGRCAVIDCVTLWLTNLIPPYLSNAEGIRDIDTIREMFRDKTLIANENPEESEYYENIGRISLHDLDIISGDEANSFHNVFSTLPMAVLEIAGQTVRYIRNNPSYREFVRRFFKADLSDRQLSLDAPVVEYVNGFFRVVRQCCESGNRIFFNERMPDGSTAHSFVRRLSVNPVTGSVAVAVAVLSVSEPDDSMTYAEIAESLAADYYNIYLIDLDTNHYIEYTRQTDSEVMSLQRHGEDFFESARREALTRICQEDRERFISLFTRENVLRTIDEQGIFTTVYRLMDTGVPVYVNMKVTRMRGSNRLILGVSVVDAPMRQKAHYEEMQKERDTLIRVMALSDGYIALYTVDLQTEQYAEFSASEDLGSLGVANEGDDFFRQTFVNAESFCFAEDLQRFREQFTRENVLQHIREDGSFSISYRLMIQGKPKQVTLKAVLPNSGNTDELIIGVRAWKDRK